MTAALENGHFPNRFYGDLAGEFHTNGSDLYLDSTTTGIVAHAGGGQANAVALATMLNVVATVATIGDSVKLPPSYAGFVRIVTNEAANSLNVFPATGDQINGAGANAAYALAGGHNAIFVCFQPGDWRVISGT